MTVVHTAPSTGPVDTYVQLGAGSLVVVATSADPLPEDAIRIELTGSGAEETEVETSEGNLRVVAPRSTGFLTRAREVHARVTVPAGSRLIARCASADTTVDGPFAAVAVDSGSGDVTVAEALGRLEVTVGSGDVVVGAAAGDLLVKSGSGDVRVDRVDGDAALRTGSGDLRIGASGRRLEAKTGSGHLHLGHASGEVAFTSGSGDVAVDRIGDGALTARTASGHVRCQVPSGTPVWTDVTTVSGRIESGLEQLGAPAEGAPYVEVRASTVSGSVRLRHV